MAVLNYASNIKAINDRFKPSGGTLDILNIDKTNSNFYKLFFTKDGHIITHSRDYTAYFSPTLGGLVTSPGNLKNVILTSGNKWEKLTTDYLPIFAGGKTPTEQDTNSILNTSLVVSFVKNHLSSVDAMRFKGSLSIVNGVLKVNGNLAFPTSCETGDTYRVSTDGVYCGHKCSAGDLLMCIKDGTTNILTTEYWTAVESNILGIVEHSLNGLKFRVYSDISSTYSFYAPTTIGKLNLVLIADKEGLPIWGDVNSLINDTWRPIEINGVSIEKQTLNIQPSEDLYFKIDSDSSDNKFNLSLGIGWFNVDTNKFEQ